MKIGVLDWKSFGREDMMEAFKELGHDVAVCPFSDASDAEDTEAVAALEAVIRQMSPDLIFSFNYFPLAATACKNLAIPYVSWVYDSPYVRMYHYSIAYPTNYVFVFDSAVYADFYKEGIPTVYYLPMAANTDRLKAMEDTDAFEKTAWKLQHEVAFVGSLYTEKHQFFQRMTGISDYTRGYLRGIMETQKQVYGCNFIEELLKGDIIEDMKRSLPMQVRPGGVESLEYLFAQYVINRQITAEERMELLTEVAARYGLDLYTPDQTVQFRGCHNHGALDAYSYAPYVYKKAKVNLNISLRSIRKGIPLRAFEIMGAGGFLLTNFQEDFLSFFVPGEDFVYFESKADLMDKISYYLRNEAERKEVAESGFRKTASQHTFVHRAKEMLSYL